MNQVDNFELDKQLEHQLRQDALNELLKVNSVEPVIEDGHDFKFNIHCEPLDGEYHESYDPNLPPITGFPL